MKANELRIGCNYQLGEGVLGSGIATIKNKFDLDVAFDLLHNNKIHPIPLTEEWLLKFGFEHDSEVWVNNIALYKCHDGFNYNVNFYEYDNLHIIQYVHQLQNLYFALTGEELTFKSE